MASTLTVNVGAVTEEAVEHLQALLRIDTTNPPGNEIAAVSYLADVLRHEGYEPAVIESGPGRGNLVARYRGTGEKGPLLLYGHVDVVMAEDGCWSHPPFGGDLDDGCLWGRGALDMKNTVVQQLMVMVALQRSGARLARDVIFAATADEEVGGKAGMGYLVDYHRHLVQADYGIGEGGGTTMYIAGRAFYDVCTSERGTCRFTLRARSHPGHGSIPRRSTAVSKIAEAVTKLSTTPLPLRFTPVFAEFFDAICAALDLPQSMRTLTEENFRNVLSLLPSDLAQYLNAITHDTAVPTGLRAGHKINVIPGEAEASIDGRYLPGQTSEGFLEEVRGVIGDEFEIDLIDVSQPLEDPCRGPLYDTIVSVIGSHDPKAVIAPVMLAGATDAKHVARMGTSCVGFGPLKVPEGFPLEHLIHGHDERVPIDGYLWGLQVLQDIVFEFCSA